MDFVKDMLKIGIAVIVGISVFAFLQPEKGNDISMSEGHGYAKAMKEQNMVDFSILCMDGNVYMKGLMKDGNESKVVEHTDNNIICKEDHPFIMTINIPKY